jgi:DNA-binding response OmpR family regulator
MEGTGVEQSTMDPVSSSRAVLTRRVLLTCSDAPVRDRTASTLRSFGLEVIVADSTPMALALLSRQSFPVVITDRTVGSTDGMQLVERVRAQSIESVYVIMMIDAAGGAELERGYCAGVDQYLRRDAADAALNERIQAAFKAIQLRRSNRGGSPTRDVVTVDLASGAHTARHLVGRLNAEIRLAQHAGRPLEIVIVRAHSPAESGGAEDRMTAVLDAVQTAVRPKTDWIACLHAVANSHRFAVVLPDCATGSAAALERHVRNAFVMNTPGANSALQLSFGHVTFKATPDAELPTALGLLAQAEQNRRVPEQANTPTSAGSRLPQEAA